MSWGKRSPCTLPGDMSHVPATRATTVSARQSTTMPRSYASSLALGGDLCQQGRPVADGTGGHHQISCRCSKFCEHYKRRIIETTRCFLAWPAGVGSEVW